METLSILHASDEKALVIYLPPALEPKAALRAHLPPPLPANANPEGAGRGGASRGPGATILAELAGSGPANRRAGVQRLCRDAAQVFGAGGIAATVPSPLQCSPASRESPL